MYYSRVKMRLAFVLSPAKTLNMSRMERLTESSEPAFEKQTEQIARVLSSMSVGNLKALYNSSDSIAKLNHQRFQEFSIDTKENAKERYKEAVYAFDGPAFRGLAAETLDDSEMEYCQTHLRILSGLYGLLRPFDKIQAYRLEMGQKLAIPSTGTKDLYSLWGSLLAKSINLLYAGEASETKILLNLASKEYFRAVDTDALDESICVVECVFKDDGRVKTVYAKRARGLMALYLIKKRIETIEDVQGFNLEGYQFDTNQSTDSVLVFQRSKRNMPVKSTEQSRKRRRE
uniref:Uncharacterized protein AlNc14C92G5757 n=1 Tax=Albugo laibachii Nc14 TaxID=890382 RepID=F0WGM9_9STRA|nr:conserved hypothetical protein [Albugo laibachii Nc14]|eukprot:CCA20393.1 conserved hypothetical protein [Albugo laibachii Nc14]